MGWLWISLILTFSQSAWAANYIDFVHQARSENPCWQVTKSELSGLFESKAVCSKKFEKLPNTGYLIRETYQTMIFDAAADKVREQTTCMKNAFQLMFTGNSPRLKQYWLNATSSRLAESIYRKGRVTRLKALSRLKDLKVKNTTQDMTVPRKQVRDLIENKQTDYERAAREDKEDAERVYEGIPFIQHERIHTKIQNLVSGTFGYSPENYPDDKNEIQKRIRESLESQFDPLFKEVLKDFDDDFAVNPSRTSTREFLLKEGYVAQAMADASPDNPKLQNKLTNCVAGDYGTSMGLVRAVPDLILALSGGFFGAAGKKLAGAGFKGLFSSAGLKSAADITAKFTMGGLTAGGLPAGSQAVIKACIDRHGSLRAVPKDCRDLKSLENFMVEWMSLQSCFGEILMNAI